MSTATLTGPRWSSAVVCPRQAVYQGIGMEGEPHTAETERRFARGRRIGEAMAAEVIANLAAQGRQAVAEHEVPWPVAEPIGTGHADLYLPAESTVIEVVSTPNCTLPANKARQVAGYAVNLGAAQAKVLSVDPGTGEDRVYPVNLDALLPEVRGIEDQVVAGVRDGVLPDRPEGFHPGTWPCMECPFRGVCMDDYEPPPFGRLPGHEADLRRLAELDHAIRRTPRGDHVLELEAERNEIRERIGGKMEDGADYVEGGVRARRTEVAGRRTFAFAAMEAAGFELPSELAAFVTEGKVSERWTMRALER